MLGLFIINYFYMKLVNTLNRSWNGIGPNETVETKDENEIATLKDAGFTEVEKEKQEIKGVVETKDEKTEKTK